MQPELEPLVLDPGAIGADLPWGVSPELAYMVLLFSLIVLPRVLVRWKIPTAITALVLGAAVGLPFGLFQSDATVQLLATLGISGLFLFAGLEVDVDLLVTRRRVLLQHVVLRMVVLPLLAWGLVSIPAFNLAWRPALLVVLALVTPSAGFILDSLAGWPIDDDQRAWVRSKTIATELVSLLVLFFVTQSATLTQFALGTVGMGALIVVLPLMFRAFATWIGPYAPKSDFAFLLMLALLAAYGTRKLGAYYLIGAFVVGMVAQRFRGRLPSITSEQTLYAVEVFASFFIPFYFFNAGLHLRTEHFSLDALWIGLLCMLILPFRVALVALHRRVVLREPFPIGARVGISLVPTLVFTLVIAELLRDSFGAPPALFGGLVIYALVNTVLPTVLLKAPPPLYDQPGVELPVLYDSRPFMQRHAHGTMPAPLDVGTPPATPIADAAPAASSVEAGAPAPEPAEAGPPADPAGR
jgi:Kef-type K+ transport system membrane component KefB